MPRRAAVRDLSGLQRRLGYVFRDPALLRRALTHRSHAADHNERLEFVGDSLLNCAVAILLFERLPGVPEGDLSRLRAGLVNQSSLCEIAQTLELGDDLLLGEGELKSGGFRRPSILADAFEALLGAVYLDAGFDAVRGVVESLVGGQIDRAREAPPAKDPKTALQENLQGRRLPLPRYAVLAVGGEAHRQVFRVECRVDELGVTGVGEGASRRAAEQQAAEAVLGQLGEKKAGPP
ncbi:MAG TPA: ribonuclease III [Usitatibacteraceae bacterium]|nr:ribonuclease III [Usitatibacteraceae bacterium]